MKKPRMCVLALAAACWVADLVIVISGLCDSLINPADGRLFSYVLAIAVTLSLYDAIRRSAAMPRTAYRLGWDARGRREAAEYAAEVIEMERHA